MMLSLGVTSYGAAKVLAGRARRVPRGPAGSRHRDPDPSQRTSGRHGRVHRRDAGRPVRGPAQCHRVRTTGPPDRLLRIAPGPVDLLDAALPPLVRWVVLAPADRTRQQRPGCRIRKQRHTVFDESHHLSTAMCTTSSSTRFPSLPTARAKFIAAIENSIIVAVILFSLRQIRIIPRASMARGYVMMCVAYSLGFMYAIAALGNLGLITGSARCSFPFCWCRCAYRCHRGVSGPDTNGSCAVVIACDYGAPPRSGDDPPSKGPVPSDRQLAPGWMERVRVTDHLRHLPGAAVRVPRAT